MERELWKLLYRLACRFDNRFGQWRYSSVEIVVIYLWAVLHDRPLQWATDARQWPDDLRPAMLPSQSTLSRRLQTPEVVQLMLELEDQLRSLLVVRQVLFQVIDGKALAVSPISRDAEATFGRGSGGWQKGYKLHAIWGHGPLPVAWALSSLHVSEKVIARQLIEDLPGGGYLLGDAQYDVNPLYDRATQAGWQLVAKKTRGRGKGGLGHRRQSPGRLRSIALLQHEFGQMLYQERKQIERYFGTLTATGGGLAALPAWVRGFQRVRNWVHAKLLAHAARWLLKRQPKTALALA